MFIIWRGWGWLVLPFFLAVWWIADTPVAAIYRSAAGYEYLYNAEKGICWAIAFFVVAIPLAALSFWRRHAERTRTPEELATEDAGRRDALAAYERTRVEGGAAPDPQTQAILAGTAPLPPLVRARSSFFFVPFWIFPFVFVAIGVLLLVMNIPVAIEEIALHERAE